jgi:tRNA-(ms[2]io[6]A)-hydroxylase
LINQNWEKAKLAGELMIIEQEKFEHLEMVHDLIDSKGLSLGREFIKDFRKKSIVNRCK